MENKKVFTKKTSVLCIYNILKKYTDENHYLTRDEILEKLNRIYGLECDRKIINSAIEVLESFDIEIVKDRKKGVYLKTRQFEPMEVKYLIDVITSSKYLSVKESKKLIDKITSDLSIEQKFQYPSIYKSTMTESKYDTRKDNFNKMETIDQAIRTKKKISFQYADFDENGNEIKRYNGMVYTVSPYYLINNLGKYYLYCYNKDKQSVSNFKVNFLRNIKVLEEKSDFDEVKNRSFNIEKYLSEHIYMWGGNVVNAKILINNVKAIAIVLEWFPNAKISHVGDDTIAEFTCNNNDLYYWAIQHLDSVKVISPADVKEKIKLALRNASSDYENIQIEKGDVIHFDLEKLVNDWKKTIKNLNQINEDTIANSIKEYLDRNILSKEIEMINSKYSISKIKYKNRYYDINTKYYESIKLEDIEYIKKEYDYDFNINDAVESYLLLICNASNNDLNAILEKYNDNCQWVCCNKDNEKNWYLVVMFKKEDYYKNL